MLNIRWSKNKTGRLLAVWVLREPGKPVVPLGADPVARSHSGFDRVDCRGLRIAA